MKQLNYIFALLLLLSSCVKSIAQPSDKFITVKLKGNVSLSIPDNFRALNDDEIVARSMSARRPIGYYTDPSRKVDLSLNTMNNNKNPWDDKDVNILKEFARANIKALYDRVTFIDESDRISGKQKFVRFEFTSEVKDKGKPSIRKYTQIQYAIRKKQVFVLNFTCPEDQRKIWDDVATKILSSMKFN
jgi:hypothetical protein